MKYYVSGSGNDKNDGKTENTAWRTLTKAIYAIATGDEITLMNGTYDKSGMIFNKNGSPDKWTILKAYPGHTPIVNSIGGGLNIFSSSYVRIEGITFLGGKDNITLDYALSQKTNLNNNSTTANGIYVAAWTNSQGQGGTNPHHIVITGNTVSNFPGGGIAISDADYITVEKNIVSGNAWYSPYGNQGITALRSFNWDSNNTDYRMIFRDNIVFNNKSLVPWYVAGKITEGHGIMLDTTTKARGNVAYIGKALIANNIVYNNGSSGIEVFKATNVDIVNNTTYKNCTVLANSGEISASYSDTVNATGNIMYANNQKANLIKYATNIKFNNNLVFNHTDFQSSDNPKTTGLQNILGKDPLFIDPLNGNFTLQDASPAFIQGDSSEVKIRTIQKIEQFKEVQYSSIGVNPQTKVIEQILGYV